MSRGSGFRSRSCSTPTSAPLAPGASRACPPRSSCDRAVTPSAWRTARASGTAPRCARCWNDSCPRTPTVSSRRVPPPVLGGTEVATALPALSNVQEGFIMATIEQSIEVNAPLRAVYNQWTQFEEFPRFMEGVEEVQQLDDKRLHWRARVGGRVEEWDAEIAEQVPDKIIVWRSTSRARNEGIVRFVPLGASKTKVELEMHWDPKDVTERIGDALGADDARIQGDLGRFKKFVEERRTPTGAWRGEIHGDRVEGDRAQEDQEAGTSSRG